MTTPVPPDGTTPTGPQPQDHDPWAPPTHPGDLPRLPSQPGEVPRPPYLMQTSQPRNGMGITALVLGLVGVVLGLFIILFWMSWLPALLAVIFGSVGLSHARKGRATNRAMAISGLVLGVVGLLIAAGSAAFTVVAVKHVVDSARAKAEEADEAKESAAAAEKARHLSFGEPYTFGNGLKVTVSKPAPFTPDEFAHGHDKGNKAVQVTVTVANTGTERIEVETGLPDVNDADGASAELVIDGSGRQKVITGYVLPGRKAVGKYAFSLPPDAAQRIEVEFSPDVARWDDAYWSGPTR
ncbi:DUF4190 domain-containing protein [Streptomyces decoyicus]|uniref:DUF4190 domain-containing protein n=1 Tax=Streptomyces decoyicus TaxID=249567 RepID=UPI0038672B0C|nr:DUF4352 domain-containing protein [Streptomyces decoyicus]